MPGTLAANDICYDAIVGNSLMNLSTMDDVNGSTDQSDAGSIKSIHVQ